MDTQMIYSLIEDAKPRVRAYLRNTDKEAWRDLALCTVIVLGSIKIAFWKIDAATSEPAPIACPQPTAAMELPAPPMVAKLTAPEESLPKPLPPPAEWMDTKPIMPLVEPTSPAPKVRPPVNEPDAPVVKEVTRTVSRYCQRHPYRRACRD